LAKSPSAGFPIAIERAMVCGTTGSTAPASSRTRRTIGAHPAAWAPKIRGAVRPRAGGGELLEPLAQLRDQRATGHRRDHRRGQPPPQLLRDLERQRLRPFTVVAAQVDVDDAPAELVGDLGAQPVDVIVVAAHAHQPRAVDGGADDLGGFEIFGMKIHALSPARAPGGDGGGECGG